MSDPRLYPARPILAASAAVFRDGRLLVARRGAAPLAGLWSFPGGGVEPGEALVEAVVREVREEVAIEIAPVGIAGYTEIIDRDAQGSLARHFVIVCFAARWRAGEPVTGPEASEIAWVDAARLATLATTADLARLAADAARRLSVAW